MSKSEAKARTISFLDGKTDQEKLDEAERIKQGLDLVSEERKHTSPTIEDNADRWRANAFSGQEWVSKHFGDPQAEENEYRFSVNGGMAYIEQTKPNLNSSHARAYYGLMVPEADLPKLARVAVDAAKAYIAKRKQETGG